jgi:hypothetical protein
MSYLDDNYLSALAEELPDGDAGHATMSLTPAAGENLGEEGEMIVLPGGIIMKKQTFWLLVGAVAAVAIYLYMKRSKRSRRRERRLERDDEDGWFGHKPLLGAE